MLKIKLAVIAIFLCMIAFMAGSSAHFSSRAESDVLTQIAGYKKWSKITEKPVRGFETDASGGG